ncbi:MAG: PKD domain-containing protein [Saprospiraceae bacterium]|jgi:PKD repeat protein|nr:PKD domain-containing protein [Saprospiraceae bacterium]MBL0026794.1 PKD domain-containing protein [Saprospiraceae bacterium]
MSNNLAGILFFLLVIFNSSIGTGQSFIGQPIANFTSPTLDSSFSSYIVSSFKSSSLVSYLGSSRSDNNVVQIELLPGVRWEINLEQNNVINSDTEISIVTQSGRKTYKTLNLAKAYQGVFSDGRDGFIRLTIKDGFVYGLVNDGGMEYYIEPLRYYDSESSLDQVVIYRATDLKNGSNHYDCPRPSSYLQHKDSEENGLRINGACYKAKLAVLADYSMYVDPAHSGADAVIDHIIGVINNSQSDFQYNGSVNFNDGINFEISEIVISTCSSCDPLSLQTNAGNLLLEFSQWVDQEGFYHPFHAAQFWTNRDLNSSTVGVAFQSQDLYCQSRARALFEDWTTNAALLRITVSHEMGHTLNGVHDANGTNFILSASINASNTTWSAASKSTISTEIAIQGPTCLSACGLVQCARIDDILISNINNQNFTVSWMPTPQNLYNVIIYEASTGLVLMNFTTSSATHTLTPPGYGICKKYDIYVYNNCSSNGLSAPIRILSIGPISQGCADFIVDKNIGWRGSSFLFTDKSLNATSWLWDFGNGQTSTLQNPAVTYNTTGSFNISLTVNGVNTVTKTSLINILPDMPAPFSLNQGGDFESNNNYFASSVHEGTKNLWELGSSNYILKTQGKAWKTILNADIGQITSRSALYSPRFDLSGYQNFSISFDMSMEVIYCNGPFSTQLQYSTNNGATWIRLGIAPGFYNAGSNTNCPLSTFVFPDSTGWTFVSSSYLNKSLDISFLAGIPSVIFRFEASVSGIFQLGYNIDGILVDNFKINASNPVPLAISKTNLTAIQNKTNIKLICYVSPTSEISTYEILRSSDGIVFEFLDSVSQNNNTQSGFEFLDKSPLKGKNYYKIKVNNLGAIATYSNIAMVNMDFNNAILLNPNPVIKGQKMLLSNNKDELDIENYKIFDITGRQLYIPEGSWNNSFFDTDFLNPGIYFLNLSSSDRSTQNFRFIVVE